MSLIRLDRSPPNRVYRTFGISLAMTGWLIGAVLHFARDASTSALVIAGVATLLGLVPLAAPGTSAARAVYLGVSTPGLMIGNVVGQVIVGAFFYLVITPIGLIIRPFRPDLLRRTREDSYWVDADPARPPESYEHQF